MILKKFLALKRKVDALPLWLFALTHKVPLEKDSVKKTVVQIVSARGR